MSLSTTTNKRKVAEKPRPANTLMSLVPLPSLGLASVPEAEAEVEVEAGIGIKIKIEINLNLKLKLNLNLNLKIEALTQPAALTGQQSPISPRLQDIPPHSLPPKATPRNRSLLLQPQLTLNFETKQSRRPISHQIQPQL